MREGTGRGVRSAPVEGFGVRSALVEGFLRGTPTALVAVKWYCNGRIYCVLMQYNNRFQSGISTLTVLQICQFRESITLAPAGHLSGLRGVIEFDPSACDQQIPVHVSPTAIEVCW
jgi:hypothetical protein